MDSLIATLDEYLVKKAPFALPVGVKEFIVRFGPWISLILVLMTAPILLVALGIGTVLLPFGGVGYAGGFGLTALLALVQVVLLVMAFPGLLARKMSGWTLLFYQQLASMAGSIIHGSIIGGLIGAVIGLYILFQVRDQYSA